MGDTGTIVAADVRGRRLDLLSRTVAESGAGRVRIVQANARAAPAVPRHLRRRPGGRAVLRAGHDPPRSGRPLAAHRGGPRRRWPRRSGQMLAQARDGRPARRPADLLDLLERARGKRGGRRRVPGRPPRVPPRPPGPFDRRPELAALLDDEGSLRTLPFRDGLEAFYAAMLVREPRPPKRNPLARLPDLRLAPRIPTPDLC